MTAKAIRSDDRVLTMATIEEVHAEYFRCRELAIQANAAGKMSAAYAWNYRMTLAIRRQDELLTATV